MLPSPETHTLASVEPASIPSKGQPTQLQIVSITQVFTIPLSSEPLGRYPSG
jgi:hypothetical protein